MELDNSQNSLSPVQLAVQRAYQASLELDTLSGVERSRGIQTLAKMLESAQAEILEANTLDLEASREMAIPEIVQEWLKLTPERLHKTIRLLRRLAELSDPILRLMNAPHPLETSQTYCQLMPLGVIALVYEAFPELAAIAAGFSLKTGNALILRGSTESSHTAEIIGQLIQEAIAETKLPPSSIEIIPAETGTPIQELVTQDHHLNLILPYGRASLVQQVSQWATAPVLRSALGNCYLYYSPSGDLDLMRWMILDSHEGEPDAVNAIEKVLIQDGQKLSYLMRLFSDLQEKGFELRGDEQLVAEFPDLLKPVQDKEWDLAYLTKIVAFKMVPDLEGAIAWINEHSSGHADCLVTESYLESRHFAQEINSALIYINSSPRFTRNPQRGDAVFLGISNQKGQRRGLISLESFTTVKQVVQGQGRREDKGERRGNRE
ncbi:glutamate-5-semialdehyde dehydrogenase [Spirulina subsalsa FACHB-351]|uniref:Gamma-glutamyl phosphate reductase n=1 Tax=Spirulina subsalsa FACHB-351 TaxID=234711 RepID=A0ABT3L1J4_9CYAN|nr:glutamate-5-semialdehyde dehydrogenase [Spirulina subsalsa]MCW6034900.1 glutamate-5-semialdehyde dehydrogenase [Spirulina subsalsa FACHB-351]